jgi:lipid-A-disaccharide synthase
LNLPHYCIVNILAGKTVFPEIISIPFTVEGALSHLESFYADQQARNQCIEQCRSVRQSLAVSNPMDGAVATIERLM